MCIRIKYSKYSIVMIVLSSFIIVKDSIYCERTFTINMIKTLIIQ